MTTPLPIEILPAETKQAMEDPQTVLLDVREQAEYETAKIDGSQLLPMSEIRERADEFEAFRDKRLIVHCHHGGRSMQVVQWLQQQGFTQVQNMAGGIDRWSMEVDPSVPRY